jgi:HK97 family phage major capsid protein
MRKQKLERWRALMAEQRDFLDNTVPTRVAADPNFDFRTDEAFKARAAEINTLSTWLQEDAAHEERSRQFDRQPSGAGREDTDGQREGHQSTEAEQRSMLVRLLTDGISARDEQAYQRVLQRASLSTGSGAVGGYLVPEFVSAMVIQDLGPLDTVRRAGAQVRPLIGRENIPAINDPTAVYQSEANAITAMTAADPTFDNVEIRPALLSANTAYSWHVQAFSPANVEQEISRSFGRAIGKKAAEKFLVGTGSDQPQGIVAGAGTGVTAASDTEYTAAELTELWYSLDQRYQATAVWIFSPEAATLGRTLESDNGAPLWYPNLRDGTDFLFGRPVFIDANMEALTADKRPVIVASMAELYVIAESAIFLVVDPYTLAANAQNRVIAYQFSDGRVKRAAAGKKLVMADGL